MVILPAVWLPRPEKRRNGARTYAAATAGGVRTIPLFLINRISKTMYPIPRHVKYRKNGMEVPEPTVLGRETARRITAKEQDRTRVITRKKNPHSTLGKTSSLVPPSRCLREDALRVCQG